MYKVNTYNNRFCYRIAKEAEIGWDEELQEPCEAYIQTTMETVKEIPQKLKDSVASNLKIGLANQLEIDLKYLEYITPEEYDQWVDD